MSDSSPPLPPALSSGRFKTIVAWVCGPIVLVELIVSIAIVIWAARVSSQMRSSERTYLSMARMLVGGLEVNPKLENGEPIPDAFYGTCAELIMGAEITKGAHYRVRALHSAMAPHGVKVEAGRVSGTRILVLRATCEDPAYAQAYLDAVLDEFIAKQKELSPRDGFVDPIILQDALVELEKKMVPLEKAVKDAEQNKIGPADLELAKLNLIRNIKRYDEVLDRLRKHDANPSAREKFSILERASPAVLVIPRFSFSSLFK